MGMGPREEKFIGKVLGDIERYLTEHVETHITEFCESEESRDLGHGFVLSKPAQLEFEQPSLHQLKLNVSKEAEKIHMLFAVAGSGKSRCIFHLLSERYGHYLVSGLSKMNDIGSRDTATAWSDLLRVCKTGLFGYQSMCDTHRGLGNSKLAERIYTTIVLCRWIILQRFLTRPEEMRSPLKWLQFQLACIQEKDHFRNLYRIMRHIPTSAYQGWLDPSCPIRGSILVCFDEAQHDLLPETHIFVDEYDKRNTLLQQLVSIIPKLSQLGMRATGVISGTSMKLQDAAEAVTRNEVHVGGTTQPYGRRIDVYEHLQMKQYMEFKPMISDAQSCVLLDQHGLSASSLRQKTYTMILQSCRRLYGRYRWSIHFITLLKNLNLGTSYSSDEATEASKIAKALKETLDRIKGELIKKLTLIHQENRTELLYQLREVTIRSDLVDRPTIFESDEALNMVTEGFATVTPFGNSKFKSCLSEPLALEAAMDFFRDHEQDIYQSRMMRFMCTLQDDHSAFGKAAEWYLAWVCLRIYPRRE